MALPSNSLKKWPLGLSFQHEPQNMLQSFLICAFNYSFTFYALNMDDMTKVKKALYMFVDLFGLERFDYECLVRFFITVKKNYRTVAYHNWTHGFHVANSIYSIVKSSPGVFKPLEVRSYWIKESKTEVHCITVSKLILVKLIWNRKI